MKSGKISLFQICFEKDSVQGEGQRKSKLIFECLRKYFLFVKYIIFGLVKINYYFIATHLNKKKATGNL